MSEHFLRQIRIKCFNFNIYSMCSYHFQVIYTIFVILHILNELHELNILQILQF